jgi:hypothetical protein
MNIVGKIINTPQIYSDDLETLEKEATYIDGWHLNSLEEIPEFAEYKVATPKTPVRTYAGVSPDKTYFYRFPDQETFEKLRAKLWDE